MIGLTILGSTGSIGNNTLDVAARHPERFRIVALTANRDVQGMLEQCLRWKPEYAVMSQADAALQLERELRTRGAATRVLQGEQGLCEVAALVETEYLMAAIVGAAGLVPVLAAARAGKRILLANKEALVMSGDLFMAAVAEGGAQLLPVDSEHNALFQCLPETDRRRGVHSLMLTASGGPFLHTPLEQLGQVTAAEACRHPNWRMGSKISVDSATMMNKGLEVIEACWLFSISEQRVEVVIHPESVVHSLVRYCDGSVLAELGQPDMRTPIAHALAWPERIASGVAPLDLPALGQLHFLRPDDQRFPCLGLAREALRAGGTTPAILNAANEAAVAAFLDGRVAFTEIASLVAEALAHVPGQTADCLETVLQDDGRARAQVQARLAS